MTASSFRPVRAVLFAAPLFLIPPISAQAPQPKPAGLERGNPATLAEFSDSLEALAARVRPAVVQIISTGFGTTDEDSSGGSASLLTRQKSTGSGVILASDGYIITNNHVVRGARKIEVKLPSSGRRKSQESTLIATVVGTDRQSDLAVIKVDRTDLPRLTLADSKEIREGQIVMAFGNPLGLEGSVSTGVVSARARQLKPDDPMVYVQTDAPINPGNSGGPLVDTAGRVIGINTLILTQSGGSEGIGFAIPADMVRNVYEQIRKDGHVHRGQIGVTVQTITPMLARGLKLPQDWGAIASDVSEGGPAAKAGLKPGDVVLSLNGQEIEDARDLENAIYSRALGDEVKLTVYRSGDMLTFDVPVHERDDDPERFADMVTMDQNLIRRLGILAIEVTDKLREMLPDLRHDYGVVVAALVNDSFSSAGGLEAGDVIYEINRTPAVSIKAVRATLDQLKTGDPVALQIEREGSLRYVAFEIE